MPNSLLLSWFLLLTVSFQSMWTASVPSCRSNSDCPVGSCCVLGMTRYATPWCQPFRQLGDECRPSSERFISLNLTYPNGLVLQLNNVHEIMCPCDESLDCDKHQGRCIPRDFPALNSDNLLDESLFDGEENDV